MIRCRHCSGFTLVEMVVCVAILGVLALMVVPMAELTTKRNKEHELRVALRELRTAIDAYKKASDEGRIHKEATASGYPPTLSTLVDGVEDIKHPTHPMIFFMRRLPRDPFAPSELSAAESWGKRSYASPHDAPAEGEDVYDIYSQSELAGINGVPYREW